MDRNKENKSLPNSQLLSREDLECPICLDLLLHPVKTNCNHYFCKQCLEFHIQAEYKCPICGQPFPDNFKLNVTFNAIYLKLSIYNTL